MVMVDTPALVQLSRQCAPGIATEAMVPLIMVESAGDTLRINVNHGPKVAVRTVAEGAEVVRRYVASGYTVDVGLAQVNSANFARLGLSPEDAFEPCTNLHAAARVLQDNYATASRSYTGVEAISATYSLYNTGTPGRGLRNGYVARVWRQANALLANGTLADLPPPPAPAPSASNDGSVPITPMPPGRDAWIVGVTQPEGVEIFK